MTDTPSMTAVTPEHLLAEADFVRNLARGLLRDAGDVDDVVQQAWLKAMERPPRRVASVRNWLAVVVRNLVRTRGMAASRRLQHEVRDAAAVEQAEVGAPSPAEILEREELRRQVVTAALALDEPYRSCVLLRYFEDLTPLEIASRLGLPASTVRTRLQRGLAAVRRALAGELDGRDGVSRLGLMLIPLARPRYVEAASSATSASGWLAGSLALGGLTMKKATVVAASALLLLLTTGGLAVFAFDTEPEPAPAVEASTELDAESGQGAAKLVGDAPRVVEHRPSVRAATPSLPVRELFLSGVLRGAGRRPVPGVRYWMEWGVRQLEAGQGAEPAPAAARRTTTDGRFEITAAERERARSEDSPAPDVGLLYFDTGDGLRAVWTVTPLSRRDRDWEKLDLPVRPQLNVRGQDLPSPRSRYRVEFVPVAKLRGRKRMGGRYVLYEQSDFQLVPRGSWHSRGTNPDFLIARSFVSAENRGAAARIGLVRGVTYAWRVRGDDFRVAGHGKIDVNRLAKAPSTVWFRASGPVPTGNLTVWEVARSKVTPLAGRVTTGALPGMGSFRHGVALRRGRARLGGRALRPNHNHRLWVAMADGEWFERHLNVGPSGEQPAIELYRGEGLREMPIVFPPPMPPLEGVDLLAEDGAGRLHEGRRWDRFEFPEDEFAVGYTLYDLPREGAVRLLRPPATLRHVWLTTRSGHVGRGDRRGGRWLAVRALVPLDLGDAYRRHARRRKAEFEFHLQLVTHGGQRVWRVLDRVQLPRMAKSFRTWFKVVPVGFKHRIVLRVDRRKPIELRVPFR